MFHIARLPVTITITMTITVAIVLTGAQGRAADTVALATSSTVVEPTRPGLQIRADGDGWHGLFAWAEARFSIVGLEIPAALVSVGPDADGCGGNAGRYVPGDVPEVQICVDHAPTSRISRLIVLHELAHLWAENRLDDGTRAEFLAMRGLDSWIDHDAPPHEWGAEHAAEVLSWGLMDEPVRIIRIYDASPEALTEAFEVLTGTAPLVSAET